MEGGLRRRDSEIIDATELGVGGADFGESSFFGFIGDGKFSEIRERWELAATTRLKEVVGKSWKIGLKCGLDDGGIGLISLNKDLGDIEMTAADSPDDLGK